MKIFPTDDNSSGHLRGHYTAGKDSTSDRNFTGKGALLVDVGAVDGFSGSLEAKADILIPPSVF